MFVVPFVTRKPLPSQIRWQLIPITLFLETRGKQLCFVEDPESWLQDNGFIVTKKWTKEQILFVEIDTEKTKLKDFYSFEQVTKEQTKGTEECWKTFYVMKGPADESSSEHSWNENFEAPFGKILQLIRNELDL